MNKRQHLWRAYTIGDNAQCSENAASIEKRSNTSGDCCLPGTITLLAGGGWSRECTSETAVAACVALFLFKAKLSEHCALSPTAYAFKSPEEMLLTFVYLFSSPCSSSI